MLWASSEVLTASFFHYSYLVRFCFLLLASHVFFPVLLFTAFKRKNNKRDGLWVLMACYDMFHDDDGAVYTLIHIMDFYMISEPKLVAGGGATGSRRSYVYTRGR